MGDQSDIPMKREATQKSENTATAATVIEGIDDDGDARTEEVDSNQWNKDTENPITNNDCTTATIWLKM